MILAIFVHNFSRLSAFNTLLFALRADFLLLCGHFTKNNTRPVNLNCIIDRYEFFDYSGPSQFR